MIERKKKRNAKIGIFAVAHATYRGQFEGLYDNIMGYHADLCDKIKETLTRYTEVFFYMWEKDEEFRKKVEKSKGFCIKHFSMLFENAEKYLKNPNDFLKAVYDIEINNLERINNDIHRLKEEIMTLSLMPYSSTISNTFCSIPGYSKILVFNSILVTIS